MKKTNAPGSVVFGPIENNTTRVTITLVVDNDDLTTFVMDKVRLEFVWQAQDHPSEVVVTGMSGQNYVTHADAVANGSEKSV